MKLLKYSETEKKIIVTTGYIGFYGLFASAIAFCFNPSFSLFGLGIVSIVLNDFVVKIRKKYDF